MGVYINRTQGLSSSTREREGRRGGKPKLEWGSLDFEIAAVCPPVSHIVLDSEGPDPEEGRKSTPCYKPQPGTS